MENNEGAKRFNTRKFYGIFACSSDFILECTKYNKRVINHILKSQLRLCCVFFFTVGDTVGYFEYFEYTLNILSSLCGTLKSQDIWESNLVLMFS